MSLFSETCTIRDWTVVGEDDYGNDVYEPSDRPDIPAWFEPRTSGEETDARQQVTSGFWLWLEPGTQLAATAQVKLGGVDGWYEVDGEPGIQHGGELVGGFVRVALRRVTG